MNKQKKKVLLVDDNHDVLDLLEILLYRQYKIITAMNGFEGLQKFKSERPDCVITDIMMPVMDGIKFFNNVRKEPWAQKIPVIGITSFVKKITTTSLRNLGFACILEKPLNRDAVCAAVRTALAEPAESDS